MSSWIAVATTLACAPEPSRVALTNATEDAADPGVVAIVYAEEPDRLRCTGTLIDARVVLTAAHCVSAPLAVSFGATIGPAAPVLATARHPEEDGTADHDLALLLLSEAASDPVVLIDDAAIAAPPPVAVRLVGFGITAPGATDGDRKREGTSVTTSVQPFHVVLGADPSLACSGDSGGPVFVGDAVAGVISRGDAECDAMTRAARVDANRAFIDAQLDEWASGSRALGDPCLFDEHCASGRCLAAVDDASLAFCGQACGECPAPLECSDGFCRHPVPSPGALGASCEADADCASGECLNERAICSVRCVDSCSTGFVCEHLGGVDFYCVPEPARGGCAAIPAPSSGSLALWLVLIAICTKSRF